MRDSHIDSIEREDSDRQLVRAYLHTRGETEFRLLYRRHTPALYRMACRLVSPSLADDVLQETWLRAARHLGQFEWRSALLTWLTGILVRCCRETWRERAGVVTLPVEVELEQPEPDTSPICLLDIERALEALPAGYREVLVLHDVEGFTHIEIARALGIVPGTSKSQLARARRALRQQLDEPAMPASNGETGT